MPVVQRKQLRRDLGLRRLRETVVGTTSLSLGANASLNVMDRTLAAPDFSGEGYHARSWIRVASGDYRVGSFNTASGAFAGGALVIYAIASGADFEVHDRLSPSEMDGAIDETILQLRARREVGLPTIDGKTFYTLDGAASPNTIVNVLNVYYYANPDGSLNRDRRQLVQHAIVNTGSGQELRLPYGLGGSLQLIVDAILQLTLGAGGDGATINLPDEETILWGAAARCYDLLAARSGGQETAAYERRRMEAARTFSRLSRRFFPEIAKQITFEQPVGAVFGGALDDWAF